MGKLFLITIIMVAIILGIITIFGSQNQGNKAQNQQAKTDNALSIPGQNQNPQQAFNTIAPSPQPTSVAPTTRAALLFPQSEWDTTATQAAIHTLKGDIVMQLYMQDAPKTVTNFATLAKKGYYDGLTFHRVESGFVIQGGDPNGDGTGGYSIYGPTFADELNPQAPSYQEGYKEGVVAMANSGPNTNGSQFFIMLADNTQLPKNYTIFGKVTKGMDVVQQIKVGDKMMKIDVQ